MVSPARSASVPPGTRISDPWLRGVVISPSVRAAMSVSSLGPTDYRALQPLLYKPRRAIAMTFADDPLAGMTTETFGGSAVAFIPTVTFGSSRTASLN
jgi:hypothetical protein